MNQQNLDSAFTKDFNVVHSEELKTMPQSGIDSFNFSLDDAYLSFDIRDSYLQRQATQLST
jgi:hypothetical protein